MLTGSDLGLLGLAAAIAAGLLLSLLAGRLQLRPAWCVGATAVYASTALLIELCAPAGVNGLPVLLLAVAGCLAIGGPVRSAAAIVACVAAVLLAPIVAVGVLVLIGVMALKAEVVRRCPTWIRFGLACVAFLTAAVVVVLLTHPDRALVLPPAALILLSACALTVAGLLPRTMRWLRPATAALIALLGCMWLPGPDTDAALLVAAAVAVLVAIHADEVLRLLGRRLIIAGVAATTLLAATSDGLAGSPMIPVALTEHAIGTTETSVRARPLSIEIPALGVAQKLGELSEDADTGELSAPADPSVPGWFAAGVVPGDIGPAVVGGHVDSRNGPGVFFNLGRLRPSDQIMITRSDGRMIRFAVTAVRQYPKSQIPTAAVYGATPVPQLRVVTCGGRFDRMARSYTDNVVVEAIVT